jgi:hypothetical protein
LAAGWFSTHRHGAEVLFDVRLTAIVIGGGMFPPQLWYPWGEGLGPYGLDLGESLLSYSQLRSLPTARAAAWPRQAH